MKKLVCASVLAASAVASAEEPTYRAADGGDWKLSWHDEFDGQAIDASKWKSGLPWGGTQGDNRHHNELYASYIMDDDASVSDGTLKLTTQKRDVTGGRGKVFHYTQAMLTTSATFRQRYGYFEVRVKLPVDAGPGLWPAFWTLADGWPPEMDICEIWTSTAKSHQGLAYRNERRQTAWDDMNEFRALPTGWAIYGMEWGPGYQIYTTDGRVTKRLFGAHVTDVPHYLLLNSAVDAQSPPTSATRFPNTFEVDYVRVFGRPEKPTLLNGGFENADLWPWTRYGKARLVERADGTSKQSLRIDGPAAAAELRVFGLKPAAKYRLSARVISLAGSARIGVKGHGQADSFVEISGSSDGRVTLEFETGAEPKEAAIYCFVPSEDAAAFFDDVVLESIDQ